MRVLLNIDVPELAPAIAFYQAAVGLKHTRTLDDDVAEMVGASSTVYLLRHGAGSPAARGTEEKRRYYRHWTPVHVDFVVGDIAEAAARAEAAGAMRESACIAWRGSRCITYSDPFGNGFCLIEMPAGIYQ